MRSLGFARLRVAREGALLMLLGRDPIVQEEMGGSHVSTERGDHVSGLSRGDPRACMGKVGVTWLASKARFVL